MPMLEQRFWGFVDKSGDCWTWTGTTNGRNDGYGKFSVGPNVRVYAHRFSWELHNGLIPEGMLVCHHCDNPLCVRPDHLFLGTPLDNMRDMWAKGRGNNPRRTGEDARNHKLTWDAVNEIRRLYTAGYGYRVLGRAFHVDPTNIRRIVKNQTWQVKAEKEAVK